MDTGNTKIATLIQLIGYVTFCVVLFFSNLTNTAAAPLPVSESFSKADISTVLKTQFPMSKTFDGVSAVFSNPQLDILIFDNELEFSITITVGVDNKQLISQGVFVGVVEYNEFDNTIIFHQPVLERVFVEKDDMKDSSKVQKVIEQSMVKGYPDFILIDLSPFILESTFTTPSRIESSIDKITVFWNEESSY